MRKRERQIRRDNDFAIIFRERWVEVSVFCLSHTLINDRLVPVLFPSSRLDPSRWRYSKSASIDSG